MTAIPRRTRSAGLLRVHAWLIVTAVVVTVGAAGAFAFTRPSSYVATSQVSVAPEQAAGTALRPEMASERQIAMSGTVTSRAAGVLGGEPDEADDGLSVSVVIESSILNIRYTDTTALAAAEGSRAFALSYVDYRNGVAGARIARVVTWPDAVERATANLPLILGVALLAGLFLGVAAAWLWDRAADRVRDPEEFTDLTGLPVLAEVPRWSQQDSLAPPGATRAAFDYVAARLGSLVSQQSDDLRIVVTSPREGAGTTTVALNTALAIAALQRDVVLVGADLHDPRLHEILDLPRTPGLLEVLGTECPLESALRSTRWPNLYVLTSGEASQTHPRLKPDALGRLLDQVSTHAIVVVDAPSILGCADSLTLVDKADVLLLVGDLRAGRRADVERAMGLIEGIRPMSGGWVVNRPRRVDQPRPRSAGRPTPVAESLRPTASRTHRVAS